MKTKAGFSLIEVVLALGIFALAVTVLSQATFNGLLSLESLQRMDPEVEDLRFVREQVIASLEKGQLTAKGEIKTPYADVAQWNIEMNPMNIIDCYQGTLHVEFPNVHAEDRQALYDMPFIIYRAGWMPQNERESILQSAKTAYSAAIEQADKPNLIQ